ncbi:MAG: hypothetical protein ACKVU2_07425 [Saprospiraceae bacterium]
MANNLLLVPIQADSLFLEKDTLLSEPLADFSRLPFFNGKRDVNPDVAYVSDNFVSPPLQNQNLRFRKGLHLHWALPGVYAHGSHESGANATERDVIHYPAAPDRWFVQRQLGGQQNTWLVESNFLWPDENTYAELTDAHESLKKAHRLARAFEALAPAQQGAAGSGRIVEIQQVLRDCATQLEARLGRPEFAFFETLLVRLRSWVYRLSVSEAVDAVPLAPAAIKTGLAELLDDFFDRRKDSISYPITPGAIQPAKSIRPSLADISPLLTNALRTANEFLVTSAAFGANTEQLQKDLIPRLRSDLVHWIGKPEGAETAFVELAKIPNNTDNLNAFEGRILAAPLSVVFQESQTSTVKTKQFERFHIFTFDDRRTIELAVRHMPSWPQVFWIKNQVAAAEQVAVFRLFDTLLTNLPANNREAIDSNIETVANSLLAFLQTNATVTLLPRSQQPFRYLGRTEKTSGNPIREHTSAYEYLSKLTAIGYGEPSFAAFYPNCHSVFGFQDTEIKANDQPVYHIVGWHHNPTDDLLAHFRATGSAKPLAEILTEKANWQLPDAADLASDAKLACFARLEHGPLGSPTNRQPEALASEAFVTLANTGREALSALLAHFIGLDEVPEAELPVRIPQMEDQLESIFFMDDLDQHMLDIGPRFREARHAQGFNALAGERLYEIKLENIGVASNANEAPPPAPKLPPAIASALQNLNAWQRKLDQAVFRLESLREQLFVDWYKYMLSAYPPQDTLVDYPDVDEVKYFIERYDMQPLRDLLFQTGQFPGHPSPGNLTNFFDNFVQAHGELQTDSESDFSLQRRNRALAADIQRTDIGDWAKIVHLLSQPELPDALQPLFAPLLGNQPFSGIGRALLHFQQLKKDALSALNIGWKGKMAFASYFLARFGRLPEVPDDALVTHDHVHNWNGLLAVLFQHNAPAAQAHADALKEKVTFGQFDESLAAYFSGATPHRAALEPTETNTETLLAALRAAVGNGFNAVQNRNELASALHGALRTAPRFVLQQTSGPRFWQPKEPTVLIAGDIARAGKRFDNDTPAALEFLPWQCREMDLFLPNVIAGFVENNKPTQNGAAARGFNFSGGAPWNPFLLEWSVELCPLQEHSNARDGDYQADYVLHHYELPVNAVDLKEKGTGGTIRGRNPNIYLGRSFLTAQACLSLEDKLKPYLAENTKQNDTLDDPVAVAERANVKLQLAKGIILSQSLGGFNAAMLMLQQNFQLPIDDPIGFPDYKKFTEEANRLVGNGKRYAPNPLTDFSPIRTGKLLINRLRLVDTFGRTADLPVNTGHIAGSSLGAVATGAAASVELSVPPRLAQPARLHFRWLSADPAPQLPGNLVPESVNAPTASPVCGWLMANQLDLSMVVFDAGGKSLGAVDADGSTVRWRPAPGWESLADPKNIANPHLRKVVAYLLRQSGIFIEKFMDGTNDVLRTIEPESFEQQQALALLMGRPMAVVRANIDLELKGVAAVHHGWGAFYRDRNDGTFERETDRYMEVRFPIRIGAVGQLNDGLVGYWLEQQTGEFNGDFYLNNFVAPNAAPVNINYLDDRVTPISQSLDPDDPDQTVCILLDPRATVHAFSGILPTKVLDIPAEQYLAALQAIDITFLTTPTLTPAERISVPIPGEDGYEWQWIEQTAAKSMPTDTGQWAEIHSYPTMPESHFLRHFSGYLFDQLTQSHWLDEKKMARPSAKRPPLSPPVAPLALLLASRMPADGAIQNGTASEFRPEDMHPVSRTLLENVLLNPAINWLAPAPTEGPEKIYRILPKEERAGNDFGKSPVNPEFAGLESRVDALLSTTYFGFRPAAEPGHYFPETVWVREGWLKLKKV